MIALFVLIVMMHRVCIDEMHIINLPAGWNGSGFILSWILRV